MCKKKNYKNRVLKKITDPPPPPAHSLGVGFLNPMPCVWDCFYTVQKITTVPSAGHCGVGF